MLPNSQLPPERQMTSSSSFTPELQLKLKSTWLTRFPLPSRIQMPGRSHSWSLPEAQLKLGTVKLRLAETSRAEANCPAPMVELVPAIGDAGLRLGARDACPLGALSVTWAERPAVLVGPEARLAPWFVAAVAAEAQSASTSTTAAPVRPIRPVLRAQDFPGQRW